MSWDNLSEQLAELAAFPGNGFLLPIIGDGIHPVSLILSDRALRDLAPTRGVDPRNPHDFISFHWAHYEAARNYTSYYLPNAAISVLAAFVKANVVRDIVTTNYDLFLDGVWERYPELRVVRNPVLAAKEYDWEGYYSLPPNDSFVRFWKIHGSLSHGFYPIAGKPDPAIICRLPSFAIGSAHNENILHIKLSYPFPYLGYHARAFRGVDLPRDSAVEARLRYYIDWNFPLAHRKPFSREIEGAIAAILDTRQKVILLLGFSGYYDEHDPDNPRNEELVPYLLDLARRNDNLYMALTDEQCARVHGHPDQYPLAMLLESRGNLLSYPKHRTRHFARYLLGHAGLDSVRRWAQYRYMEWTQYYYRHGKEPEYAVPSGS